MEIDSNNDASKLILSPVEAVVVIGEIEKYIEKYEESDTLLSNELDTLAKLKNEIYSGIENNDASELVLSPVEKFIINRPTVVVIIGEIENYEESHTFLSNELDTLARLKNKIYSDIEYMDRLTSQPHSSKAIIYAAKNWKNGPKIINNIMTNSNTVFLFQLKQFSTELSEYVNNYGNYLG